MVKPLDLNDIFALGLPHLGVDKLIHRQVNTLALLLSHSCILCPMSSLHLHWKLKGMPPFGTNIWSPTFSNFKHQVS